MVSWHGGTSIAGWFIRENLIQLDDLGPRGTPISGNFHMRTEHNRTLVPMTPWWLAAMVEEILLHRHIGWLNHLFSQINSSSKFNLDGRYGKWKLQSNLPQFWHWLPILNRNNILRFACWRPGSRKTSGGNAAMSCHVCWFTRKWRKNTSSEPNNGCKPWETEHDLNWGFRKSSIPFLSPKSKKAAVPYITSLKVKHLKLPPLKH